MAMELFAIQSVENYIAENLDWTSLFKKFKHENKKILF